MSEHLLFLQAAGSDFGSAHDLADAISEAIRAPHDEQVDGNIYHFRHPNLTINNGFPPRRPVLHPDRIAERLERAGCKGPEGLLVALAAHATIASPVGEVDVGWIASVAARIGDEDLLRET